MQICLAATDNSITFTYKNFHGTESVGTIQFPCDEVFENGGIGDINDTLAALIGVQDSTQSLGTTYMGGGSINDLTAGPRHCAQGVENAYCLESGMAVQFKQWNDVYKTDSIIWPPANYEFLQGDSITPIVEFENVSSSPQSFTTYFQIRSVMTGQPVFAVSDSINVAPLSTKRDTFPTYYTYAGGGFTEEVGAMYMVAFVSQYSMKQPGDEWPFDDSLHEMVFVIEQLAAPFYDLGNEFSTPALLPGTIPSNTQWVTIGASVVDGEQNTLSPPPPRGLEGDTNKTQLNSPVMMLDRRDAYGNFYSRCASGGGKPMPTFPLNPPQLGLIPCQIMPLVTAAWAIRLYRFQLIYPRRIMRCLVFV